MEILRNERHSISPDLLTASNACSFEHRTDVPPQSKLSNRDGGAPRIETYPIDYQHLTELRAVLGNDKFQKYLGLLLLDLSGRTAVFRSFDWRNDMAGLRSEAHNFRGMISNFGLRAAALAARAVENALPGAEITLALERLESEVRVAVGCLMANLDLSANVRFPPTEDTAD